MGSGTDRGATGTASPTTGSSDVTERGQSEVLGAVLLVALVLAFAALLGQFVPDLGLDNSDRTVVPQVSFGTTVADGELTVEPNSGSGLDVAALSVVGTESEDFDVGDELGDTWETDERVTISPADGQTVRIYWRASGSDDSATLLEYEFEG